MIGQMASAIALLGFNDLGRAVTPLFLLMAHFPYRFSAFKGPSQPPPFSMPSRLLILHGATKSYCFTVSCVPGSMFDYL